MSHTPLDALPARIDHIISEELSDSRVVLVTSQPGIGRNEMLRATLETRFPGEHVIIDALSLSWDGELIGIADELEHAAVVCFDGLAFAERKVRTSLVELITTGHSRELPVKFQPSRIITLRDDVVIVVSEQSAWGDRAEALLAPAFPDGGFRRIDLSV